MGLYFDTSIYYLLANDPCHATIGAHNNGAVVDSSFIPRIFRLERFAVVRQRRPCLKAFHHPSIT